MSTLESEPPNNRTEGERPSEREHLPYHLVAQFTGERPAGRAYTRLQEAILRADCDLSSYRFQLRQVYHVAAVGIQPPEELERRIKRILSVGTPTTLPDDILRLLQQRRAEATKLGPWVERHMRPGYPLL